MNKKWFRGKKITVFGIGMLGGGTGVIRFLASHGAHVIATDIKTEKDLATSLEKLKDLKNVTYILGRHRREDFSAVDMVIKTPSCPWTNEHVRIALKNDIPVETDASLFLQLCTVPIVGITGTKGKTTTSHLIAHLLRGVGRNVLDVGIGTTSVLDRVDLIKKDTVVVFELSSWRLSALKKVQKSPQVAVFTNIFPDHLNYYKSMEEYLEDKKQIFLYQKSKDTIIYNADNERLKEIDRDIISQPIKISASRLTDGRSYFLSDSYLCGNDGIDVRELMERSELPLRGEYNHMNVLMAFAAVKVFEESDAKIIKALRTFKGVPHRSELVRVKNDVSYINDTAATAPEAAIAAIIGYKDPIVLIAGGSDKKLPVKHFAEALLQIPKDVVFLAGEGTDKIFLAMRKIDSALVDQKEFAVVHSMQEAVVLAEKKAVKGDIVLLSPGMASFGIFKNEFDRGAQFRTEVKNLS